MADIEWRRADSVVRPQRYAVLVEENKYWLHTSQRLIEIFTQLWGGEGFILIPSDGKKIDEKFWRLIEAYNPDYIGYYNVTLTDLKWADPKRYQDEINFQVERLVRDGLEKERAEEFLESKEDEIKVHDFDFTKDLQNELLDRISPFHHGRVIERNILHANSVPNYPLTQVKNIIKHSKEKPIKIFKQKELSSPVFNLLAKMRSGALTEKFEEEIYAENIEIGTELDSLSESTYLRALEIDKPDTLSVLESAANRSIPADFIHKLPYTLSTTSLSKYQLLIPDRVDKDNVTVVIGSSFEDFCFAFTLHKLIPNVHWLPDVELVETQKAIHKLRAKENIEGTELPQDFKNIRSLTSNYAVKIGYGQGDNKKLIYTSISLTKTQLANRRNKIQDISLIGINNLADNTVIVTAGEIDLTNPYFLLEANNYRNQQAVPFQEKESVESLRPIKPKGFVFIDPKDHRWIQSTKIKDFDPPRLPEIGNAVFNNKSGWNQVRNSKDGISFLLPSVAYFNGNDIDTTLSPPDLKLLSSLEMFAHYFAGHYLVSLSDKGRYFEDTVNKFGSLDEAGKFFKNSSYTKLLVQFTEDERADEDKRRSERIYLTYTSRSYLNIEQIQLALGDKIKAENIVNYLLSIKVLRRGLILHCETCFSSVWYDIENVGQGFTCSRCRTHQLILKDQWKKPKEPSWYYSIDEMVFQFFYNNSHITLLAIYELSKDAKDFHYVPEIELKSLENGKTIELDIACVKNGNLIFGEAKIRKLQVSDLNKYVNLNRNISPSPSALVFASGYSSIPSAVRQAATQKNIEDKTIFYTSNELFS